jgi:hypothetical protein
MKRLVGIGSMVMTSVLALLASAGLPIGVDRPQAPRIAGLQASKGKPSKPKPRQETFGHRRQYLPRCGRKSIAFSYSRAEAVRESRRRNQHNKGVFGRELAKARTIRDLSIAVSNYDARQERIGALARRAGIA